jgi:hypothetical protein
MPHQIGHRARRMASALGEQFGRFPVTHYYEQCMRLLDGSEDLRLFLEKNKDKRKLKQK